MFVDGKEFEDGFEDEFEENRYRVTREKYFNSLIETVKEIRDFLNDLGEIAFGRDIFLFKGPSIVNGHIILDSAARTMESIRYCCMNANFADAYSLLRKLRDDLFYYAYLITADDAVDITNLSETKNLNAVEKNILNWMHNKQKGLYIDSVIDYISSNHKATKAIEDFDLKESLKKIAKKLNNYVHSNGYSFYNESLNRLHINGDVQKKCEEFSEAAIFITMAFVFVLALISPFTIMSSDYTDCLDAEMNPLEGSQYWVAPFISDFLYKYDYALDEKCVKYLKENTEMQI